MARYWVTNFCFREIVNFGFANQCFLMQYQYTKQQPNLVALHWNRAAIIRPGDWLVMYLSGTKCFAVGEVIPPRLTANYHDTVRRTVESQNHQYNNGVVHYSDAPAFYENFINPPPNPDLAEGSVFAQRIDVKEWLHHRINNPYRADGIGSRIVDGIVQNTIFGIDERFFNMIKTILSA